MPAQKNWVAERRHEGRNADLGDEEAVDEADQNAGRQPRDHGEPAELVFLEQNRENEAGKGDDRGKAEVDFARPDDEREARGEQDQRRQGGEEGRVDIGREEHLRRPIMNSASKRTKTMMIGSASKRCTSETPDR